MPKVLVAEPVAAAGIELLRAQAGWDIVISSPKEYSQHLADCDALLVRSAVQVDRGVIERAHKLRVIGRAGVGVDNVDLDAATAAGVLVMNTPGGNAISVAEHTLALMLAMARHIPQASASTRSGKWEKKKFLGNELRGKTLGIVGLGSIGRQVVRRARAFEMRVVAHDPYVTAKVAQDLGVDMLGLVELYEASDYITLHVAATPETQGMLSQQAFAAMKPGVRIVNCARGELVDEAALAAAIESGKVAGAAMDVFSVEPPPAGFRLFATDAVLATPHIGGSTEEAQEIVGVRIAEQVVEYLKSGVAINAVNMPALTPEQYRALGPYATLAERLGTFAAQIGVGSPHAVRLVYCGKIADADTHLLRNAAMAGVLSRSTAGTVNLVNAMQIAEQRGWQVAESRERRSVHTDSIRLELATDRGATTVEGAVHLEKPRLTQVDGIYCEVALAGFLTFMKNRDVPGVIGHVGTVLGRNRINIANFSLGRRDAPAKAGEALEAVAVVSTDELVPERVLAELRENPAVEFARAIEIRG
ncbi:MAG TPA: phosphoglycerate dehydrogenase [Bryobacteraceae bacterium]|nr:phosphoglycerate dehydrogenase [Bryobacteraceae bacterium]